jgi:hypothetical protein
MDVMRLINGQVDTVYRNADLADFADMEGEFAEAPEGEVFAGFNYDGETFTAPQPEPEPVPGTVSRLQAKAALFQAGLLSQVEAAISEADPIVQMAWADAIEFRRHSPVIIAMADELNLSEAQVDDLFRSASLIEI